MNKKYLDRAIIPCVLICLILCLFITCKPVSSVPAKLILHAPLYGTARVDGTLYIFGDVTNVGSETAYNGHLSVIINGGEREYECFLSEFQPKECRPIGDFKPGERKFFECDLVDYCSSDEMRCTFRLTWDNERPLVCVSMDSDRLSIGD